MSEPNGPGEGEVGAPSSAAAPSFTKLALDLGPLLVFFAINATYGIFAATAVFMVAVIAALIASRILLGAISPMPVVTAVLVLVFGGLTLYLHDETFIKLKPTILYILFASLLLAGLAFRRLFLQMLMQDAFSLTEAGWRKLTLRWALFFLFLAGLNELVWRTQTTDFWVSFKVFGLLPLTLAFAALQIGLLQRHSAASK
ncbi:MAG: septation protein A [Alphaproteobacteria bacterium]|nr:MAG: septation protein A [Alphaproteobacteria bacterium]